MSSSSTPASDAGDQFDIPTPAESKAPPSREALYMSKASKRLAAERKARRADLKDPDNYRAITRATERLAELAHPDQHHIVIRSEFIYQSRPRPFPRPADQPEDITTRPPLTRVLHGKNPHAIALFLTGIYEHQMRAAHAQNPTPPPEPTRRHNVYNTAIDNAPPWTTLVGLAKDGVSRRNRRKTFSRALDALRKWDLVDLGATGQRYTKFSFNIEDGTGHDYAIPLGDPTAPKHLCLPTEFFTKGWHLVLTASELATFLAIAHEHDRRLRPGADETSFYIAESIREKHLGLSEDAYLSIHQLAEFRLIEVDDPMPNRRRGRVKQEPGRPQPYQPYHFTVPMFDGMHSHDAVFDLTALKKPAIDVAIGQLDWPLIRYAMVS